jgi:hypothetical protein
MKRDNALVLIVISWILIVLVVVSIFVIYEARKPQTSTYAEVENATCKFDDLEKSMECLIKEQGKWFKYNISNKALYWNKLTGKLDDVDWSVIKEQGGVCSHSSVWYVMEAQKLGYKAETIRFFGNETLGHEIALIYEKDLRKYCLLDQSKLGCVSLKRGVNA